MRSVWVASLFLAVSLPARAAIVTYCISSQESLEPLREDISPFIFIKDQPPQILEKPESKTHCLRMEVSAQKEEILNKLVRERHPGVSVTSVSAAVPVKSGVAVLPPACRLHIAVAKAGTESNPGNRWVYAPTTRWTKVELAGCSLWLRCHRDGEKTGVSVSLSPNRSKVAKHFFSSPGEDWITGLEVPKACERLRDGGGLKVGLP